MRAVLLNPLNPAQDIKLLILKIKTLALLCDIFLHIIYLDNIFSKFSLETFWPTLKVAQHAWAKFTYSISIISLVICRKGDNYQQLSQQSQNKFSSEKKKKKKIADTFDLMLANAFLSKSGIYLLQISSLPKAG